VDSIAARAGKSKRRPKLTSHSNPSINPNHSSKHSPDRSPNRSEPPEKSNELFGQRS